MDRNRSGNPKSISIFDALQRLDIRGDLSQNLKENVEALIELRDNAIHFVNIGSISKHVQELEFACVKNYVTILKKWEPRKSLNKYNLYLMPLAYVDSKIVASAAITQETQNFINHIKTQMVNAEQGDEEFDIAVKISLKFQKGSSFDSIGVQFNKDGLPVTLTEEVRSRFPLTYDDVRTKAKTRYSDFKQGKDFNRIMPGIKQNSKIYYERKLDTQNPKSQKKGFYSTNIWQTLDLHYIKK